ncbi:Yip1 family protein [Sphingopyxis sp. R3-92]|uniref:Yip1 family protein n=1 Tax=Sphingopyxis sp. R3-92 TaxID=3158553 RepID=UPI003EE4606F
MSEIPSSKTTPPTTPTSGVIERAKNIILKPKETWAAIDTEPATVQSIYVPYVVLLAAIGPVAQLIGGQVFGYGAFGVTFRPSLGSALGSALLSYGLALASIFVLSLIIDALAPNFGGQKNQVQALKVAAYSATAGWLAGIFGLIPALAILGILGLYGLYLLYLGLPILMKVPEDKAAGYTIVVVIAAVVIFLIIGVIVASFAAPSAFI